MLVAVGDATWLVEDMHLIGLLVSRNGYVAWVDKKPKVKKSRYSFSKLPAAENILAVARFLERYPPDLRSDLEGLLMIGADRHMVQSAIDQYTGPDRANYPGSGGPDS
jgi:hypothetical protein